ncbi:hypothetical protein AB0O22_31710 [Streptomyces sp. NPDC091204]|uniref:hypothetical protein n=1 Tax=Streptomyces sp. NPDC091204 TaxID=3155299 RepID=UPI00343999A8
MSTTVQTTPASIDGRIWDLSIPTETHGGSPNAPGRHVLIVPGRTWAHVPATCPVPDTAPGEWIGTGPAEVLVCTGCGLDVT